MNVTGNPVKFAHLVLLPDSEEAKTWVPVISVPAGEGAGGRGEVLRYFNTGRLRPVVQPLTLSDILLAEKVSFYTPFIEKRHPFHIPTLGSVVLIFM